MRLFLNYTCCLVSTYSKSTCLVISLQQSVKAKRLNWIWTKVGFWKKNNEWYNTRHRLSGSLVSYLYLWNLLPTFTLLPLQTLTICLKELKKFFNHGFKTLCTNFMDCSFDFIYDFSWCWHWQLGNTCK